MRNYVAITKGEEGHPAHVDLFRQRRSGAVRIALQCPFQQPKSGNKCHGPEGEQDHHGQRAEDAEEALTRGTR